MRASLLCFIWTIRTDGHLQTTETDAEGRFWIALLPEGQYSVRASDQTRVSEWLKNVWVSRGHETDVTLHLRQQNRVASYDLSGPSQKVSLEKHPPR